MNSSRKLSVYSTMYRYAYAEYLMYLSVPVSQVTSKFSVDSGRLAEVNRNHKFIYTMKKTFRKRPYETVAMRGLALEKGESLAASIIAIPR